MLFAHGNHINPLAHIGETHQITLIWFRQIAVDPADLASESQERGLAILELVARILGAFQLQPDLAVCRSEISRLQGPDG